MQSRNPKGKLRQRNTKMKTGRGHAQDISVTPYPTPPPSFLVPLTCDRHPRVPGSVRVRRGGGQRGGRRGRCGRQTGLGRRRRGEGGRGGRGRGGLEGGHLLLVEVGKQWRDGGGRGGRCPVGGGGRDGGGGGGGVRRDGGCRRRRGGRGMLILLCGGRGGGCCGVSVRCGGSRGRLRRLIG